MTHPSRLALDRLALGEADPALEQHLAACPDCRAHLAAVCARPPMPAWLHEAPQRRTWWRPLAFAGALAAVALVVVLRPAPPDPTTPKGLPAVTVWLKRGDVVSTWDGVSPVRGGDSLRLEAVPAGYAYVTVVATGDGGPTTLFAAKLDPHGKPTLTPAWQLDAQGASEHLAVLFTRAPVDDTHLSTLLSRRDDNAWCIHEVLPKEVP